MSSLEAGNPLAMGSQTLVAGTQSQRFVEEENAIFGFFYKARVKECWNKSSIDMPFWSGLITLPFPACVAQFPPLLSFHTSEACPASLTSGIKLSTLCFVDFEPSCEFAIS